ncbi:hypothetical protein BT69DRAFT_1333689 [Atractiella rhizophila]|nr:hypothetical protein BT69DRAFT_1333689 [Atractiella rhizophila]
MSLNTLTSVYSTLESQAVREIHPGYFPVTIFGFVHSLRIGVALKQIIHRNGSETHMAAGQVAFVTIVMVFGGGIFASLLLNQIPSFLHSPKDMFVYAIGALAVTHTKLGELALQVPELPLETFFALLDGFARAWGVTSLGVDNTLAHSSKDISSSAFAVIFLSTLIGAGGDLLVPLFNGFSHTWTIQAPTYLTSSPSFEIWSCTAAAVLYSLLIDNPSSIRKSFGIPESSGWISKRNVLKPAEAKAICAAVLMVSIVFNRIVLSNINVSIPLPWSRKENAGTKQSARIRWSTKKRNDPGNKKKTQ